MSELLDARKNPFNGMIVNPENLPYDPAAFREGLRHSLEAWRDEGILTVWLEVPIDKSTLVPVAVDAGFSYHHAHEDYVMLTLMLVEHSYIPPYATHYIGAGGVVLNDSNELLVVREKYGFRGRPPTLKLPGGALRQGEHLIEAVEREVLEETGVHSRFESIVCFRHWHGYRYGKSDIYFVCRLRPLSSEITMQTEEIQECLWMPVGEFLEEETVSEFNKWIVRAGLASPGMITTDVAGFPDGDRREFLVARAQAN